MKHLVRIIFFFLLALGARAQDGVSYSDEELLVRLWPVGELHNQGAEEVYKDLTARFGDGIIIRSQEDRNRLRAAIDDAVIRFTGAAMGVREINLLDGIRNMTIPTKTTFEMPLAASVDYGNDVRAHSPAFQEAVGALDALLETHTDYENADAFRSLAREQIGQLPVYQEKLEWVAAVSTAFHSLQYWKREKPKWQELILAGSVLNAKLDAGDGDDPPAKKIAKADVSGAIKGAIWGGVGGAVGGTFVVPGVGTVAGAAGGAAVGGVAGGLKSSVNAAVDSFVDWLFGEKPKDH